METLVIWHIPALDNKVQWMEKIFELVLNNLATEWDARSANVEHSFPCNTYTPQTRNYG